MSTSHIFNFTKKKKKNLATSRTFKDCDNPCDKLQQGAGQIQFSCPYILKLHLCPKPSTGN